MVHMLPQVIAVGRLISQHKGLKGLLNIAVQILRTDKLGVVPEDVYKRQVYSCCWRN